jgi:hypothetical protein
MDLREIEWKLLDWFHLVQDRGKMADSFEYGNEPSGSIEGSEFID